MDGGHAVGRTRFVGRGSFVVLSPYRGIGDSG
jgi:hypothetical protein